MSLNERNIFLVDGIGAVVSAILLGIVLPFFHEWVGIPISVLYFLAFCAVICATYSLCCFRLVNHKEPNWLKVLILANLIYCGMTIVIVTMYWSEIKVLGLIYFIGEVFLIFGIAVIERRLWLKRL